MGKILLDVIRVFCWSLFCLIYISEEDIYLENMLIKLENDNVRNDYNYIR